MTADQYRFRPMTDADLPMVQRWLAAPHVAQWWGDPGEQFGLVSEDLKNPAMDQFIVATGDRDFGYLQSYDLDDWPDETFRAQPPGTRAIDHFIGEPDMVGRGHGSAFIRALVDNLLATGAPRVITDPDVANARAIRACWKAGFRSMGEVDTIEGRALLMVRSA
jgi:aminoglycoside 6'-N-acetyltransferase